MRICIVSNFKQPGFGESTRPGQLAKHLKLFGHEVLHICDWEGTKDGIKHLHIARDFWEPNLIKRILIYLKNYFTIVFFKPDVVYVHQFNNAKWAIKTKLLKNRKIVFDAHTSVYFEQSHFTSNKIALENLNKQEGEICRSVDLIVAASEETKEFLTQVYSLDDSFVYVVGNATDMLPIKKNEPVRNTHFVCLTTLPQDGFKSNEMALEMLLEVAAETFKVKDDIRFYVVGGGKMPTPKSPNVIYTGYVKDLRQTILSADICLMPFPANAVCGGARNKFCDYIALGKPVVTTSEGLRGMQVLVDGKNCLVANSVSEYVSIITELSINREKVNYLEKEVFSIRNSFNWQDRAKKVELIFNCLMGK